MYGFYLSSRETVVKIRSPDDSMFPVKRRSESLDPT